MGGKVPAAGCHDGGHRIVIPQIHKGGGFFVWASCILIARIGANIGLRMDGDIKAALFQQGDSFTESLAVDGAGGAEYPDIVGN